MEVMEKLATFKVKCRDLYGDAFSYIIVVTFLYILWISNLIDKIFNTQGVYDNEHCHMNLWHSSCRVQIYDNHVHIIDQVGICCFRYFYIL